MKDFIFTDPSESTTKIVFRTDLIGSSNNNFSIMKVTGLDPADVKRWQHKKRKLLAQGWKIGTYTNKLTFTAYALANGLDLVMQDSNGDNATILVDYNSDAGASSW